jgi:hypothetical protein
MKNRLLRSYGIKSMLSRAHPFTDVMDDTELLCEALMLAGRLREEDIDKVLDETIPDEKRFNYETMKKKYAWAQNWELASKKHMLAHQWIGKCILYLLVYFWKYTNRFNQ